MVDDERSRRSTDIASGHTVRRYDQELLKLRHLIVEMGEHVVEQIRAATVALVDGEDGQAFRVLDREPQIDFLSLDADEEVFRVIARRQPTAVDLRIVLALSKIAAEVERAGDEAARIAHQTLELIELDGNGEPAVEPIASALRQIDAKACSMFERSIQAVETFDVPISLGIFEDEPGLTDASNSARRILGEQDCEGLTLRQTVPLLTCAQAMKRIGNHASNIAEQVIYVALGQDIRYRNREILIETLRHQGY